MFQPGPIHILTQVQIGVTVAVEVSEGSTGGPGDSLAQPGFLCGVLVASPRTRVGRVNRHIAKQGHPSPACHEQVGPSVAVVIGHRNAVGIEPGLASRQTLQTGGGGHLLELVGTQIPEKGAGVANNSLFIGPCETAPTRQKEIEKTIAIEVEDPGPTPERFQNGIMIR